MIARHGLIQSEHPALYHYLGAVKDIHCPSMMAYLIYMAIRIMEIKRLLKSTGSIYLHCAPTASHYLKIVMDQILGGNNSRNEIVWQYKTGGTSKRWYGKKHDTVLFYSSADQYTFSLQKQKSYLTHKYGFSNIEMKSLAMISLAGTDRKAHQLIWGVWIMFRTSDLASRPMP